MKSKYYIEYEELCKKNQEITRLKKLNIVMIPKKKLRTLGYIILGVAVLSIPVPGITPFLFLWGFMMLGLSKYHTIEEIQRKWRISQLRRLMR